MKLVKNMFGALLLDGELPLGRIPLWKGLRKIKVMVIS